MRPDATGALNRTREWSVFVERSVRPQIVRDGFQHPMETTDIAELGTGDPRS